MRNTPGLTARCNPRLSLADQSRNREKLAEEKGLFDSGWGLWSSVAAQTHTYMFINYSHIFTNTKWTYYRILHITRLWTYTAACLRLKPTLLSLQISLWAYPCERQMITAMHWPPPPTHHPHAQLEFHPFFFCFFLPSISLTLLVQLSLLAW